MGETTQDDESGLLTIHDVTRAHAGVYQCTANNGLAPPASVDVHLVVQCECIHPVSEQNLKVFIILSSIRPYMTCT